MFDALSLLLKNLLIQIGLRENIAIILSDFINFILVIGIGIAAYYITNVFLIKILKKIAKKTKTIWDNILLKRKVFNRLVYFVPAIVIYYLTPFALRDYSIITAIIQAGLKIYMMIIIMLVSDSFLNAILDIYQNYKISKTKPIKGYIQVIQIIIYVVCSIIIISIIINRSPLSLLAGLGALSAVLMLIFKDSILGFVGSFQLSSNDMVRPGDWISIPKYGADGIVKDMTLTTVKIQNWDKTITTVPIYNLISDSFQNWRGMEESGGRRIKRSINIDMNSVKFCTEQMLKRFEKIKIISDYVRKKQQELEIYNDRNNIDDSVLVNGRRQTNLGIFRAYLIAYLKNNPNISNEMTFLVRQKQPTENGIPIEIYVFSKIQEWAKYEDTQSDIFDHILAIIPEFELQVFQNPSGADFKAVLNK